MLHSTRAIHALLAGLLIVSLAWLTGCSSEDILAAQQTAAPTGKATVSINWPQTAAQNRYVSAKVMSVLVTVTGPGIPTAIFGVISYPDRSITLSVPAGINRTVLAQCFDSVAGAGQPLVNGVTPLVTVTAGATTPVTVKLIGVASPYDDATTGATDVGTVSPTDPFAYVDALDTVLGDVEDWYSLTTAADVNYSVTLRMLDQVTGSDMVVMEIDGTQYTPVYSALTGIFEVTAPIKYTVAGDAKIRIRPNAFGDIDSRTMYELKVGEVAAGMLTTTVE